MKHIVTVTYSDPGHEFISLRGRTQSTNYVVEARDIPEAQNRASSYFRSMGYKIHSAVVNEQKAETALVALQEDSKDVSSPGGVHDLTTKDHVNTGSAAIKNPTAKKPADHLKKPIVKPSATISDPKPKPGSGMRATISDPKPTYSPPVKLINVKPKPAYPPPVVLNKEEAEQIDELKKSTLRSYATKRQSQPDAARTGANLALALTKAAGKPPFPGMKPAKVYAKEEAAQAETQYIEEKLKASDGVGAWIHDFVHSDNPKFEGKSKKERIQQALGAYYAAKREDSTNEEMKPYVKAAQVKFDAQTKAQNQKPVQAGTLAAKARREGHVSSAMTGHVAEEAAPGADQPDPSNILPVIKAAAKSKTLAKQASPKIELGLSKDNPVNAKGPKDEDITEAVEKEEKVDKKEALNKEVDNSKTEVAKAEKEQDTKKKQKAKVIINPDGGSNLPHIGNMSISGTGA